VARIGLVDGDVFFHRDFNSPEMEVVALLFKKTKRVCLGARRARSAA
jgi:hypothetical protein